MCDWQLFRNFKYSVFYVMFAVSMDKTAESEKCFQKLKKVNLNDNFTSTVISKIELCSISVTSHSLVTQFRTRQ